MGDIYTTSKITKILEILNDGKWHPLKEIQRKTELNMNQIQQAIAFLEEYCFITVDQITRKVMLDQSVQEFLVQKSTS